MLATALPVVAQSTDGELRVVCVAGAEVTVDGESVGACGEDGTLLAAVAAGEREVVVRRFGYEPVERQIGIYAEERSDFEVDALDLRPVTWIGDDDAALDGPTWKLVFRTVPEACSIECYDLGWEGHSKATTRWVARGVHSGEFSISFEAGDDTAYHDFTPKVGETLALTVYIADGRVEVNKGDLHVTGADGATLELDGKAVELRDGLIRDVEPGEHTVRISRADCHPHSTAVTVTAGGVIELACPPLMPLLTVVADGADKPATSADRAALYVRSEVECRVECEALGLDLPMTGGCSVYGIPTGRYDLRFTVGDRVIGCDAVFEAGRRVRLGVDGATREVRELPPTVEDLALAGELGPVGHTFSIAIDPSGRLAVSVDRSRELKLWDLHAVKPYDVFPTSFIPKHAAFDSTGRFLVATADSGEVAVFDVVRGRQIRSLPTNAFPRAIAFQPGTGVFATASWDNRGKTLIQLWDVATGAERSAFKHDDNVHDLALHPSGESLAFADSTAILVVRPDGTRIKKLARHKDRCYSVAFSPDGSKLASGSADDSIKIWDTSTWRVIHTLAGSVVAVRDVAWSPDGRYVAAAADGVQLWDAVDGVLVRNLPQGNAWPRECVAFSPDGRTLVAAGGIYTLRVWRMD